MGMSGGSGKGGAPNIPDFGADYFQSQYPVGPVGGRTAGKTNNGQLGGFRMPPPRPSLQQQYAGLNQGVQGFQPLGIRGYTPPSYGGVGKGRGGFGSQGGFNPLSYNSFQGNPFQNVSQLQLGNIGFTPQPVYEQAVPTQSSLQMGNNNLDYDTYNREAEDYDIATSPEPIYETQAPIYETQVVEGGADIKNRIDPVPLMAQTQATGANVMPTNLNVGKAAGGRVQGFAEGGMPEENQTSERLEEETIMALMGKHPNPKQVFNKYLEVYGEEGLMALAAEVEQMMSSQGRMIDGAGGGVDDFVPAMIDGVQPAALSKDEYVIPADVVAHAGDGSSEAGGKQFDQLVSRVRQSKTGNTTQPEQIEFEEEIEKVT